MSCNWGTELWDQFDNLEKHTGWGIDFLERYTKFVKERADIELSYAKQIRSLSKKYHPKRSREDESRYTWCLAFAATLQQLNEMAAHREDLADNLHTQIVCELMRYTQELKAERKTHFQDGRRAQQHIESSWKQLESSKRRFERDCKEAERAQHISDRIDLDNKADGEKRCSLKARQTAQQKQQAAEDSRKEYVTSLNQFNQDQHQHYRTLVPVIYQRIQDMEERRIERIAEAMRLSAESERKVLPVASRCLDAMMDAAESIQPRKDTGHVVEVYKSGFDPPGDVEFEDYSATMRRSISESSYLDNRAEGRRHSRKLWPFLRKNKLLHLLSSPRQPPPPPPTSPSPGEVVNSSQSPPTGSREPITQRLSDLMSSGSRTRKQCLRSLKRGGSSLADCSHLPPEQRRKKLLGRINNINQEIQREREQRDALLKMRDVYERSPQMGDARSLDPRLEEVKLNLQRLEEELRRNQVWLSEADGGLSDHSSRRQSGGCGLNSQATTPGSSSLKQLNNRSPASRESPDGSYTEDQGAELHFKSRSSEFDDDFDDEEPLPSIGTCKSLYPFQGQNEGTLSMVEGELLSVVEEDKGDGWTRVRRNLEEEGYVPTSYIKVFLDNSAKVNTKSSYAMEELRGLKSMEAYDQDIRTLRATGGPTGLQADMEDQKGQTSDFYRTDPNLPQRFNNPDSFQGYGVKKIHPLYRTWNQTYGSKTPTVHEMQTQFKVTSHRFSELQLQSGMYKDHGFNTALERSKVMVSTEIQNKRLQHLRHYGNQSKEHHHQNSITQ